MKSFLFFVISLVALMVTYVAPSMAQSEVRMFWTTADQCKTYVVEHNGDVLGYRGTPRNYKGKKEDQKVTFAIPKGQDGCYPMNPLPGLASGGYVIKRAGDPCVYRNQNSVCDADPDCDNALGKPILFTDFLNPATAPPANSANPPATVPTATTSTSTVNININDCSQDGLVPKSMTTPARGILRTTTVHAEKHCNGSSVVMDDRQMTVLDERLQEKEDELAAKVEIAEAKAKAKASRPPCSSAFCRFMTEPAVIPVPVGYVYSGYGYGGGNTFYGGGYRGGYVHTGNGGGAKGTYGGGVNTGGAH